MDLMLGVKLWQVLYFITNDIKMSFAKEHHEDTRLFS
ncbi:Uncharacterised protein [Pseudoalteromonas nigrifaciens]|nr:Uncharacterised protein [Pseudoalteromonas nigrifaciens]